MRAPRRLWSPSSLVAGRASDGDAVQREADAIVDILREEGPLHTAELRRRLEARLWRPGRFGAALDSARRSGRVHRAGRRSWAAAPPDPPAR